ncbi:MAG: uracil-DNA glycosylase [Beijerinckiaceae bacterium]|nr:MAG: uracil-DNA glycosylase [Beijerinckiaceae bacterium]
MAEGLTGLLRWYAEMGVDIAVDAAPHDRFAESRASICRAEMGSLPAAPPGTIEISRRVMRDSGTALPPETTAASAWEQAAAAQSLDDLRERLSRFEGCGLKATATRLVFGDGNPSAKIMFVGEAPGADEDREGVPFVGRAGQLLDKMLASIGLDRGKVYIANVVPWRPPGNRTPTPLETSACLPFTRRQIELVDPKILVCLGGASAQTLLGGREGVMRMRGRWFAYLAGNTEIRALAMLHPAFLLRQPAHKKLAWQDLRTLAKELNSYQLTPVGSYP